MMHACLILYPRSGVALAVIHEPFGCLWVGVGYDVLYAFKKLCIYLVINLQHGWIDYGHVQSGLDGMI